MARESQGLQISLIIFVMLCVILGVTTYIYHQQADTNLKATKAAEASVADAQKDKAAKEAECTELKRIIGMAERTTGDITEQFDKDMKSYSQNFPGDVLFYSPLLARMKETIDDRTGQILKLKSTLQDLQGRFELREAAKDAQMTQLSGKFSEVDARVAKIQTDYNEAVSKTQADEANERATLETIKVASRTQVAKAETVAKAAQVANAETSKALKGTIEKIRGLERPNIDIPSGEIKWVNAGNHTVWIDRGRADSLERQIKFGVYSADSTDVAKAVRKATIEVTRIIGDHSAEARILDDKISDPIMPGDKIHTPLWSPGEQNHFALAGIMNLDGDGRNALGTVRGLITMNGGVVDAELDEQGNRTGEITANTRFLVLGETVDPKSSLYKKYTDMINDADRLAVKHMPLSEFKQRMGYQKTSSIEHFGHGTTAGDVSKAASAAKARAAGGTGAPASGAAKKDTVPKAEDSGFGGN